MLLHPLVIHFPLALWLTSFFFDLLAWRRPDPMFRRVACWLVGLGMFWACVGIAFGWLDLLRLEREGIGTALRLRHELHSQMAYAAMLAYAINLCWRWRNHNEPTLWFLAFSFIAAVLIGATGYLGGELRIVM